MSFLPYIIVPIILAFLGLQMYPYFKLKATRGQISPSLATILPPGQLPPERAVIYFMSPQCGMCRNVTPVVDELAQQRDDIIRLDASESPELAREFGVMGTPAFVLVEKGIVAKVKLGAMSRHKILEMLDRPRNT